MEQVNQQQNEEELQSWFTESVKQRKNKIDNLKQELDTCKDTHSVVEALPRKIEHEIMVPLGDIAYMPGKLIHTNELLVLLGDNYFAKRSAYQTEGILTRREDLMKERIHKLNMELDQIYSKMGLISNFEEDDDELLKPPTEQNSEKGGTILKQPQSKDSNDKSKEKRVSFADNHSTSSSFSTASSSNQKSNTESLESKLEELERQEAEAEARGESIYNEDRNETSSLSTTEVLQQSLGSLINNIEKGNGEGSGDHINIMEPLSEENKVKIEEVDDEDESSSSSKSPESSTPVQKQPLRKTSISEGAKKAFSGVIQERSSKSSQADHKTQSSQQKKKVSKFKQMRQQN
eukprot:gb/GECH01001511.1/.p1 GENE.gb/GECH01001511.1/~~gb/GECH01001511.1/.p1  ORF type:complete len:348 (+),score=142.12 gb/GECH01001511.1/:1-1044(+)